MNYFIFFTFILVLIFVLLDYSIFLENKDNSLIDNKVTLRKRKTTFNVNTDEILDYNILVRSRHPEIFPYEKITVKKFKSAQNQSENLSAISIF